MSPVVRLPLRLVTFAALALGTASAAYANWTGTWDSRHGELRLVQEGDRVYGDYANRGYFEGRVSNGDRRLRGTFQYTSSTAKNGYIEFQRSGDSFTGGWTWAADGPANAALGNWTGSLKNSARPAITSVTGNGNYWAAFWSKASASVRGWMGTGVPATAPAPQQRVRRPVPPQLISRAGPDYGEDYGQDTEEWNGTFDTNHGEIRLVQIGRRVFGDYAQRGYFEGCTHDGGLTLRGTFQYNSPRSKHGFIAFRMEGDGFQGTWTWTGNGPPSAEARVNWSGARSSLPAPSLIHAAGMEPHFADSWVDISDRDRRWVIGSEYYDSCDGPAESGDEGDY